MANISAQLTQVRVVVVDDDNNDDDDNNVDDDNDDVGFLVEPRGVCVCANHSTESLTHSSLVL